MKSSSNWLLFFLCFFSIFLWQRRQAKGKPEEKLQHAVSLTRSKSTTFLSIMGKISEIWQAREALKVNILVCLKANHEPWNITAPTSRMEPHQHFRGSVLSRRKNIFHDLVLLLMFQFHSYSTRSLIITY